MKRLVIMVELLLAMTLNACFFILALCPTFNDAKLALQRSIDSIVKRKRSMVLKQGSKALTYC
jgi:hypothetical protein